VPLASSAAGLPPGFWLGAGVAAVAGIVVFLDARRRANSNAAAWGVGVFLMLAVVLPLYVFRVRRNARTGGQQTSAGERQGQAAPVPRAALTRTPPPLQARALRLVAFLVLLVLMEYWKTPIWLEIVAMALLAIWLTRNDLQSRQQKR
jgi:hypothetical protein